MTEVTAGTGRDEPRWYLNQEGWLVHHASCWRRSSKRSKPWSEAQTRTDEAELLALLLELWAGSVSVPRDHLSLCSICFSEGTYSAWYNTVNQEDEDEYRLDVARRIAVAIMAVYGEDTAQVELFRSDPTAIWNDHPVVQAALAALSPDGWVMEVERLERIADAPFERYAGPLSHKRAPK